MKRAFLTLLGCATALPLPVLAVDDLIIVGHGNTPSTHVFSSPPQWLPYLIPLIFFLAGIIQFFYPRISWRLKMFSRNWEFADPVEPSGLWLFFARVGGLVMIGFSVMLFITVHSGVSPIPK